jgi:5-methylcytosine-specific restriction endonuclease McrA
MPVKPMRLTPHRARASIRTTPHAIGQRGTTVSRGYDAAWKRCRLAHLAMEPMCRHHLARAKPKAVPATEVDHIIDITDAPDLRLEHDNLQSLCKPCHSAKTMATMRAKARAAWR